MYKIYIINIYNIYKKYTSFRFSQKFHDLYFCEIFELRPLETTQKINKWLSSL